VHFRDIDAERLQEILQGCSSCRRHKESEGGIRRVEANVCKSYVQPGAYRLAAVPIGCLGSQPHQIHRHLTTSPQPRRAQQQQQRCHPLLAASSIQIWTGRKETGCLSDQLVGLGLWSLASSQSPCSTLHGPRSPQSCRCCHRQPGLEECRVLLLCSLGRGSQFRWRRTL
jgi:hypothetical protein